MSTSSVRPDSRRDRRRVLLRGLITSAIKLTALIALYFLLPLQKGFSARTLVGLTVAVCVVIVMVVLEYHATVSSPFPRLTAAVGLSVVIALFTLAFAIVYYLMELDSASSFNATMTRLDALYFTTTVLTTVGFGDITATSETARAVITVQMFADLILIGVIVRVLRNAVGSGLSRRASGDAVESSPS
jgi:voltage-gated potassium channel